MMSRMRIQCLIAATSLVVTYCSSLQANDVIDLRVLSRQLPSIPADGEERAIVAKADHGIVDLFLKDVGELEIQLGNLPCDSTTTLKMPVRNLTGFPIRLDGMSSSCGCITLISERFQLDTGEDGEIAIRVKAPRAEQRLEKQAFLEFSSDKLDGRVCRTMRISGVAKPVLAVTPQVYDLSVFKNGVKKSSVFTVTSNFSDVQLADFEISLSKRLIDSWTVTKNRDFVWSIEVNYNDGLADMPFSECQEAVHVKYRDRVKMEFPFTLSLRERFFASPKRLYLSRQDFPSSRQVILATKEDEPVVLEQIEMLHGDVVYEDLCKFERRRSSDRLAVYTLTIDNIPNFSREGVETVLRLKLQGQSKMLLLPVVIVD